MMHPCKGQRKEKSSSKKSHPRTKMKQPKTSASCPNSNHHFFKFLFPDPLPNLRIPKEFYKHLPTVLPRQASLVTQSCKIWKVDVRQSEEGICLSRGWSEFVKAHDLQLGYFLLFRYEGKMVFSVKVFDTTCCLKDYALTPREPKQPTFVSSKVVDLTSDVKSEGYSGDAQIPVDSGKKRKNCAGKAQLVCEEDADEGEPIFKRREKKKKIQKSSPTVPQFEETLPPSSTTKRTASLMSHLQCWTGEKQQTACNRKKSYSLGSDKSTKRITANTDQVTECDRTIARYHISHGYMNFPIAFCKLNGLTSNRTMKLKDSENHEWTIKFCYNFHARFTSGWRDFIMKNGLKIGDKLKFTVVAHDTMLFCPQEGEGHL